MNNINKNQAVAMMKWYIGAGLEDIYGDKSLDRFSYQPATPKIKTIKSTENQTAIQHSESQSTIVKQNIATIKNTATDELDEKYLQEIKGKLSACKNIEELLRLADDIKFNNLENIASNGLFFKAGTKSDSIIFLPQPEINDDKNEKFITGKRRELFNNIASVIGITYEEINISYVMFKHYSATLSPSKLSGMSFDLYQNFAQKLISLLYRKQPLKRLILMGDLPLKMLLGSSVITDKTPDKPANKYKYTNKNINDDRIETFVISDLNHMLNQWFIKQHALQQIKLIKQSFNTKNAEE